MECIYDCMMTKRNRYCLFFPKRRLPLEQRKKEFFHSKPQHSILPFVSDLDTLAKYKVQTVEEQVRASAEHKLGVANQSITAGFFDNNTRLILHSL